MAHASSHVTQFTFPLHPITRALKFLLQQCTKRQPVIFKKHNFIELWQIRHQMLCTRIDWLLRCDGSTKIERFRSDSRKFQKESIKPVSALHARYPSLRRMSSMWNSQLSRHAVLKAACLENTMAHSRSFQKSCVELCCICLVKVTV